MSAIGNYIHLTHYGYLGEGTKRKHTLYSSAQGSLNKKYYEIQNRIKNLQIKNDLSELENKMNNLLASYKEAKKNYSKDIKAGYTEGMSVIKQVTDELFHESYSALDINFDKLSLQAKQGVSAEEFLQQLERKNASVKKAKYKSSQLYISTEPLYNRINYIRQNMEELINQQVDMSKIQKGLAEVESSLDSLDQYIRTFNNEKAEYKEYNTYLKLLQEQGKKISQKGRYLNKKEASGVISEINKLLGMLCCVQPAAIGDAFEIFAAAALVQITEGTYKVANDYVKSKIVGGEKGYSGYNQSNFIKRIDFSEDIKISDSTKKEVKKITGKNFQATIATPTKNKVDLIIEYKQEELRISAKNYDIDFLQAKHGGYINVVTSSLLTFLQEENSADFVNHFLNLTISKPFVKDQDVLHSPFTLYPRLTKAVNKIAMEIMLLKGLTGDNITKFFVGEGVKKIPSANVFMVNDNSKGKIHMVGMGQLIDFLIKNNGYKIENFSENFYLEGYLASSWSAEDRIVDLINRLHTLKCSVLVNYDSFLKVK